MAMKSKIADEEIRKYINEGKTNAQIAKALGVKQPNINVRINKLRAEFGKLLPDPEQPAKPEALKFENIQKDDRLMLDGKRLVIVAVGTEGFSFRNMQGSIKFTHRKEFEKNIKNYTKVPPGDPQGAPVKAYKVDPKPKISAGDIKVGGKPIKDLPDKDKAKIVEHLQEKIAPDPPIISSLLEGRKPATINPEFEAAVQEMVAENEAKKVPCVHFTQNCKDPRGDDFVCTECQDYQDELAEEAGKPEPIHLDLEMDSISDPVESFGSAPDDYTDPEWFDKPIPRKGTVERAIWDKAYKEIEEIRTLRSTILSALNCGERLPNTEVGLYNKYVSKYQQEVGA